MHVHKHYKYVKRAGTAPVALVSSYSLDLLYLKVYPEVFVQFKKNLKGKGRKVSALNEKEIFSFFLF